MALQYKPTKQKKEKPVKEPKTSKAEKPVSFGSAKAVKIEKPKKVKELKIKAPKPEKAEVMSFTPSKAEKASDLNKGGSLLKKSIKPVVAISIASGVMLTIVLVAVLSIALIIPAVEKRGMEIERIDITQQPEKLVYLQGEEANYDGLRVTVTRKNGETFVVRASECDITGFSTETATESLNVTVSYGEYSNTFSIKVLEHEKPKPVLKSIWLEPEPRTEYGVNDYLDVNGIALVCEYMDGSTERVNLRRTDVYGWDKVTGPGTYELTVRYAENGVLCTYTYTITVTE